jgi:folate-binding protein YgfZ
MKISPLLEYHHHAGFQVSAYRGSETLEYAGEETSPASSQLPALYDASWRSALAVSGADARKWLNGMITANVRDLTPGRVAPSFQLDPKGHILAMFDVACVGADEFFLLSDEPQAAGLEERLRRFVFISKLTLEDRSEQFSPLLVRSEALAALVGLGITAPAPGACTAWGEGWMVASAAGVEIWQPPAATVALWRQLAPAIESGGWKQYERRRVLDGEPAYGAEITGAELVQETGELARLDYTKGCYVGQEIVERVRARGAVHRHLARLRFEAAMAAGTAVEVEGAAVGRITSVTSGEGGSYIALGYMRDPHAATGTMVTAGGVKGEVRS